MLFVRIRDPARRRGHSRVDELLASNLLNTPFDLANAVKVIPDGRPVLRPDVLLKVLYLVFEGVQDAAVFFGPSGLSEHAIEGAPGIDLDRKRRRLRTP